MNTNVCPQQRAVSSKLIEYFESFKPRIIYISSYLYLLFAPMIFLGFSQSASSDEPHSPPYIAEADGTTSKVIRLNITRGSGEHLPLSYEIKNTENGKTIGYAQYESETEYSRFWVIETELAAPENAANGALQEDTEYCFKARSLFENDEISDWSPEKCTTTGQFGVNLAPEISPYLLEPDFEDGEAAFVVSKMYKLWLTQTYGQPSPADRVANSDIVETGKKYIPQKIVDIMKSVTNGCIASVFTNPNSPGRPTISQQAIRQCIISGTKTEIQNEFVKRFPIWSIDESQLPPIIDCIAKGIGQVATNYYVDTSLSLVPKKTQIFNGGIASGCLKKSLLDFMQEDIVITWTDYTSNLTAKVFWEGVFAGASGGPVWGVASGGLTTVSFIFNNPLPVEHYMPDDLVVWYKMGESIQLSSLGYRQLNHAASPEVIAAVESLNKSIQATTCVGSCPPANGMSQAEVETLLHYLLMPPAGPWTTDDVTSIPNFLAWYGFTKGNTGQNSDQYADWIKFSLADHDAHRLFQQTDSIKHFQYPTMGAVWLPYFLSELPNVSQYHCGFKWYHPQGVHCGAENVVTAPTLSNVTYGGAGALKLTGQLTAIAESHYEILITDEDGNQTLHKQKASFLSEGRIDPLSTRDFEFYVAGLEDNVRYCAQIRAVNDLFNYASPWSPETVDPTSTADLEYCFGPLNPPPHDIQAPFNIDVLTLEPDWDKLLVQWEMVSHSSAVGFTLNIFQGANHRTETISRQDAQIGEMNYAMEIAGLEQNTEYCIWMVSFDDNNALSHLSPVNPVCTTTPYDITQIPPEAPSQVTLENNVSGGIVAQWQDNSDNELAYFVRLYQGNELITERRVNSDVTSTHFYEVEPETTYCVQVAADGAFGVDSDFVPSLGSDENACITTPAGDTPAGAPTDVFASAHSPTAIRILWSEGSGDIHTYYINLYHNETLVDTNVASSMFGVNTDTVFYGLTEGEEYCAQVQARSVNGNSHWEPADISNTDNENRACIIAGSEITVPPNNVEIIRQDENDIVISWDADMSAQSFNVELLLNGQRVDYARFLGSNDRSWTFSGYDTMSNIYCARVQSVTIQGGASIWNPIDTNVACLDENHIPAPQNISYSSTIGNIININFPSGTCSGTDIQCEFWYFDSLGQPLGEIAENDLEVNTNFFSALYLSTDTEYCFGIYLVDDTGNRSLPSNIACGWSGPPSPQNFHAINITTSTIEVEWESVSSAISYKVGYKIADSQSSTEQFFTTATNFTIDNLETDTLYNVSVSVKNERNHFSMPTTLQIATLPMATSPEAPSMVNITAESSDSIRVSWQDNSENENQFDIRLFSDNGESIQLLNAAENATMLIAGNLTPSTNYCVQVSATNDQGNSEWAPILNNEVCATTLPQTQTPSEPPSAPTGLRVSAINWTFNVMYDNNTCTQTGGSPSNPATDCEIWLFDNAGNPLTEIQENYRLFTSSLWLEDFESNKELCLGIYRIGEQGQRSAPSNIDCGLTPPATPELSIDEVTDNSVSLSWTSSAGAIHYWLGESFTGLGTDTPLTETTHVFENLESETYYCFYVRADNHEGNHRGASWEQCITTLPASEPPSPPPSGPDAPTGLQLAGLNDAQINITYDEYTCTQYVSTNNSPVSDCEIWQFDSNGNPLHKVQSHYHLRPAIFSVDIQSNTHYCFGLYKFDAQGQRSAPSNIVCALSAPATPALYVDHVTESSIRLSWTVSPGAIEYWVWEDVNDSTNIVSETFSTFENLAANTQYCFGIFANNHEDRISSSSAICATTQPTPPSRLEVAHSEVNALSIEWTPVSGVENYTIRRYSNDETEIEIIAEEVNASSYTIDNLTPNAHKCYGITTGDGEEEEVVRISNITCAYTLNEPELVNIQALDTSSVRITWSDNSQGETGYEILLLNNNMWIDSEILNANTSSYQFNNLDNEGNYCVRIRSLGIGQGKSRWRPNTNFQACTTLPGGEWEAPILALTRTATAEIDLTWNPIADADHYEIREYNLDGLEMGIVSRYETNLSSTIFNLEKNQQYCYGINAVKGQEISPISNIVCGHTLNKPTNTSVEVINNNSFEVTWTDTSIGELGYDILLLKNDAWQTIEELEANATSFRFENLSSAGNYCIRIRSRGVGGGHSRWRPNTNYEACVELSGQ